MPSSLALRTVLTLSTFAAAPASFPQLPTQFDLSWVDSSAFESGMPVLELGKNGRVTIVHAAILIDAPVRAIWDILVACEIAPEYVPNVVDCRSIELLDGGASEFFIQTVKPAFFIPSFEHVFRMDYQPHVRIEIHRVSGPIKQLDGQWWLQERSDGKVALTYFLLLDPGLPIPRMFVRATLRRDLPRVLEAVRQRAQTVAEAPP